MKLLSFLSLILLTSACDFAPDRPKGSPLLIVMESKPENSIFFEADRLLYFSDELVQIVEAPDESKIPLLLKLEKIDGAVISLSNAMKWSADGLKLTIVGVVNGSNEASFPLRRNGRESRLSREAYNVVVISTLAIEKQAENLEHFVDGWVSLSNYFENKETYNLLSVKENKELLMASSPTSLQKVMATRSHKNGQVPVVDGRFFESYVNGKVIKK